MVGFGHSHEPGYITLLWQPASLPRSQCSCSPCLLTAAGEPFQLAPLAEQKALGKEAEKPEAMQDYFLTPTIQKIKERNNIYLRGVQILFVFLA